MKPLPDAWKHRYPFRLGAPSFVLPAGYEPNVRYLGPALDTVELLFLESRPESIPSKTLIAALRELASTHRLSYTVHLPTDLDPGSEDRAVRRESVSRLLSVLERTAPLNPLVQVLHLDPPREPSEAGWSRWQANCSESLRCLPRREDLAIENLLYPFEKALPILDAFQLAVCMDVGHLVRMKENIAEFFAAYGGRISCIHLQGADGTREHLALDRLPSRELLEVRTILKSFRGVVTLEVFDPARLMTSLKVLEGLMEGREPGTAGNE
ncbi:MAG: cobamide remodeling phosphodiesterase CbiR [Desulfobacterales bacterium]